MYDNVENAEMPFWIIPGMVQTGMIGADMPSEYGGKDMSVVDLGASMYQLARVDAGVATFFILHHSLG